MLYSDSPNWSPRSLAHRFSAYVIAFFMAKSWASPLDGRLLAEPVAPSSLDQITIPGRVLDISVIWQR